MRDRIAWLRRLQAQGTLLKKHKVLLTSAFFCGLAGLLLLVMTYLCLQPLPASLSPENPSQMKLQIVDRNYAPLTYTYNNHWNIHDCVPIHKIPEFLQQAFIISEDKRFWGHQGVDWLARLHALGQNITALRQVRGASTITEQVVRMLHPRPRTFWSRWLEGFEANALETKWTKVDILEFYLNQVPFAAQRRGIVQAARYYFDRDLDTLSNREMLALTVLVRAPSRLDLYNNADLVAGPVARLTRMLMADNIINKEALHSIAAEQLHLSSTQLPIEASHFATYAYATSLENAPLPQLRLHSTIDSNLQAKVQKIMDQRLRELRHRHVFNGGALVIDHHQNEILAWVVGNAADPDKPGSQIDSILALRQPGSTLKPFLYALAMDKGWTAATMIDDSPLTSWVSNGLHTYHNYSRSNYGLVTLREALGNSLNIPAVRTIQFVGVADFLTTLHRLGITSLREHPDFYGDGLALGNGEISLLEMVQAYAVLARQGVFQPLKCFVNMDSRGKHRVFSEEISSLIGNILSDPEARRLEFGNGSILRFPLQTAVKTGTSSDYRDAWALGYNHRYTFGAWIGNMDGSPMEKITGSTGPALILRAIAAELTKYQETRPLYLSPKLVHKEISVAPPDNSTAASSILSEWFVAGTQPNEVKFEKKDPPLRFIQPTNGLLLAMDPRIPDQHEAFEFILQGPPDIDQVEWYVDKKFTAKTANATFIWHLQRGEHSVRAKVWLKTKTKPLTTAIITFVVT
jgi:penicillin-binding protein 1C